MVDLLTAVVRWLPHPLKDPLLHMILFALALAFGLVPVPDAIAPESESGVERSATTGR